MAQTIRNETLNIVRKELEGAIRARALAEVVEGGMLAPLSAEQIFIQRKLEVGKINPPTLFVFRGPWTNGNVGGHTIMVQAEYHFCPLVFGHDIEAAEDEVNTKMLNCFDMFISRGDRSFDGSIYDVLWLDSSDVYALEDREAVYFGITRLRFDFLKRTK